MILLTSKDTFERNIEIGKQLLKFNIEEAIKKQIRKGFDNCIMDHSAQAHIEIAIELGYKDLADEMTADLEFEISKVA